MPENDQFADSVFSNSSFNMEDGYQEVVFIESQSKEIPMERKTLYQLITQIHASQNRLHTAQLALDHKLTAHMTEETQELAEAITSLMKEAFPDGDPDGHRRHHELVIEREEERKAFWQDMRKTLAKWGMLALVGWAFTWLWKGALNGPLSK